MRSSNWLIFLCLAAASALFAQTGTVKSGGQPIPGATVRATQGDRVLTTLTDANGDFKLDNMGPGMWSVDVTMFGFDPAHKDVQIGSSPTRIDFGLQLRQFRAGFGGGGFGGPDFGGAGGRGGFGGGSGGGTRGGNGDAAGPNAGPRGGFGGANANGATPNAAGPAALNNAGAPSGAPNALSAEAAANAGFADGPNATDANGLVGQDNGGFAPQTNAAPGDNAALPQVNASGANEAFLVNGSLSTGLNTQASDFAPFGPGGLNAGGISAAQAGANVPGVANQGGANAGGLPPGPGAGPVIVGGGGGFPGGGFGGGGFGGRGGRGGFGPRGGPNGPGNGVFIGNRRNAGRRQQIRGSLFYSFRNSELDAAPFSLNGQGDTKAPYSQNRFGFNIGGPLEIPKLLHSDRTFFFLNYTGNLLKNGLNLTGTVPTLAERGGDFSALNTTIYDPISRQPYWNNQIPLNQISPIALGLLKYIPVPNQPGTVNNYRLVIANPNNSQSLNARVMQNLSRRDQLAVGVNWQTRDAENTQLFGFTDSTSGDGINANINWRHNFGGGLFNNLAATFNRNTSDTLPFFAYGPNVAAELGIQGTSSDPINYGPPNLNFTNFGALSDGSPVRSDIYSFGGNETLQWRRGNHNWTFGGGYQQFFNNTVTDANGRGTFVFSGLATSAFNGNGQVIPGTGYDFADFLLGLPQSNSIRYGSSSTYFRTDAWNAFGQDDWRVRTNLTLNLGLRYEFFAPWHEKYNRIANLDIAPGYSAVAVVTPGQTGPYSGVFPAGLIHPDRNNFAPRTALAWKPWTQKSIVVRLGYGWYYNPGIYNQFMGRLSAQPPFAQSTNVNTSVTNPLTLATGLTVLPNGKTITNTFAVDPNYATMYAQTWNASVQSNLSGSLVLELAYIGTKGTHLDIQGMPNQAPPGSPLTSQDRTIIANATNFTLDAPWGNSIYHAGQVRLNRRFRGGFSGNLLYTFSKSIDNSSTLGGAGNTVAQNFYNLSAERGLSSFDRRHSLTANYVWTSPVNGTRGLLANSGWITTALKDWTISGNVTLQSGTPLTARVLGNLSDTAGTGNVGSGRASATGLPVESGSGFFNLAAFTTPAPGTYGNAGRNTIPGPLQFSMGASLQRTISITERMRFQIRVDASNVTNHVNITNFGTVVNSINYGVPTAAAAMRSLNLTLRLNF